MVKADIQLTIIIPTYNRCDKLIDLFKCLGNQTSIETIEIETFVVDNNSTDQTYERVEVLRDMYPKLNIKYLCEPQPGAANARIAGAKKASGELLAFIDDDILLSSDWIAEALKCPAQGNCVAWSGNIRPVWYYPPTEAVYNMSGFLGVSNNESIYEYDASKLKLPPSAALIIKREALVKCGYFQEKLISGANDSWFHARGDDYEMLSFLEELGGIWHHPGMECFHLIPQDRVKTKTFSLMCFRSGLSHCTVRSVGIRDNYFKLIYLCLRVCLGGIRRIVSNPFFGYSMEEVVFRTSYELGVLSSPLYFLFKLNKYSE